MGHVIRIEGSEIAFEHASPDTVLRAALRAKLGFPYECNSGGCGTCAFEIVSGQVRDLWPDAPGLSARQRQRGKRLACQSVPCSDLVIKARPSAEYLPVFAPRRMHVRLQTVRDITHDIREFRFRGDAPALFRPGQYASLMLDGINAPRCYSMSNLPNADGHWEFQIRRVPGGRATTKLFDALRPGDQVELDGPYGHAWLREDSPRDIVCIAGGSGLAPMVSIARGAAACGILASRRLHFFYGARTPRDVCGEDLLRELPAFGAAVRYIAVVSDAHAARDAQWDGETGFVHEALVRHLQPPLSDHEFYFAGPPPMTQAVQELLMATHRVPFAQIHFDRFF